MSVGLMSVGLMSVGLMKQHHFLGCTFDDAFQYCKYNDLKVKIKKYKKSR